MLTEARTIYRSRADQSKEEAERIRKQLNRFAVIRLILFFLAIFFLARWLRTNLVLAVAGSVLSLLVLLVFVRLGSKRSARKRMLEELVRINEQELGVLDWNFEFFNPGNEYSDPQHPYASDLDIFGEHSLFQYLNRTATSKGSDRLAETLGRQVPVEEIPVRQAAVGELSEKVEWRQEFLASGRMSEETREDYAKLNFWLNGKSYIASSPFYKTLLLVLPALTILSIAAAFLWIPYNIPVFLVLIQLGIVGLNLRQINHHHNQLTRKFQLVLKFSSMIRMIEEEVFASEYLSALCGGLSSSGIKAGQQLQFLARLTMQFDRRLNMVMGLVLNALVMWDLQCIRRLEKWKSANAVEVPRWFHILSEFEALNSLGNFAFNIPDAIFPELSHNNAGSPEIIIETDSLGHPLIPSRENIRNDLKIKKPGEFLLITGSNMAGKSTFLRCVGVNLVLAGAGAPVAARKMIWHPIKIMTNMRVRDSLSSRESTFYAELKRLRMILEEVGKGEPVLVLLDEILKGTNSRDKHFGSEMFIRQLIREGATGLIATHDLELSMLEDEFPGRILNYCFEVQIDKQEFIYDYTLRRGVCQTLNATELMKKMGISFDGNAQNE